MPELRKDPVVNRWVLISTDRDQRPTDFIASKKEQIRNSSPFLPGNEAMTPPEILSLPRDRSPETPWTLRVVPNKYPAITNDGALKKISSGMFQALQGPGSHEVIIETPEDDRQTSELSDSDIFNLMQTYAERICAHKANSGIEYVQIFKNQGPSAGATLKHAHSQLLALPHVPQMIIDEINGAADYYNKHKSCVYCDIIQQEKKSDTRVIFENEQFLVITPYASRFSHEIWILPKKHESHFETLSQTDMRLCAEAFKTALKKIDIALNKPDLNYVLHTAPVQSETLEHYHWHWEILPRVTGIAGFELGSGIHINPTKPEDAAEQMKKIII
ncbi:MAG: galactose-1-phosphate uridylyltransferase [Calditrichota bacterium]